MVNVDLLLDLGERSPEEFADTIRIFRYEIIPAVFDEFLKAQLSIAVRIDKRKWNDRMLLIDSETFEEQFEILNRYHTRMVFIDCLKVNNFI